MRDKECPHNVTREEIRDAIRVTVCAACGTEPARYASLFIPGPLPGQNEIIAAAKSGRGKYNAYGRLKKQWGDTVLGLAKQAGLRRVVGPVSIHFRWDEPSRRRDIDNIAAGAKFVLDGLVKAGVLDGDGWANVDSISHAFGVSAKRPGVNVMIQTEVPF